MNRVLHAPDHLTPADLRRLARLRKDLDTFLETDRRYFERRRDRTCRLRRAHRAEMAAFATASGSPLRRLPRGGAWFMLVSQVRPGARIRQPLGMPRDVETDLSEQDCLALKSLIVAESPANDLAAAFEALVS